MNLNETKNGQKSRDKWNEWDKFVGWEGWQIDVGGTRCNCCNWLHTKQEGCLLWKKCVTLSGKKYAKKK